MSAFSYTITDAAGAVTSGTDTTGQHTSAEAVGEWYRSRGAVEVRVWAGEPSDRPAMAAASAGAVMA